MSRLCLWIVLVLISTAPFFVPCNAVQWNLYTQGEPVKSIDASHGRIVLGTNTAVFSYVLKGSKWIAEDIIQHDEGMHSFGETVALFGETLLVGAPESNSVYVYNRCDGRWCEQQFIQPINSKAGFFGGSLALTNDIMVVGGSNGTGEVFIYSKVQANWTLHTILSPDTHLPGVYQPKSNQSAQSMCYVNSPKSFGYSVAIDGNKIVVGGRGAQLDYCFCFTEDAFSCEQSYKQLAHVFEFSEIDDQWVLQDTLSTTFHSYGYDEFDLANSVAVKGDTVVVGSYVDQSSHSSNYGAVYIFNLTDSSGTWYDHFDSGNEGTQRFGWSVDISEDGQTIVAGTKGEDFCPLGTMRKLSPDGTWWEASATLMFQDESSGSLDCWVSNKIQSVPVAVDGNMMAAGYPLTTFTASETVYISATVYMPPPDSPTMSPSSTSSHTVITDSPWIPPPSNVPSRSASLSPSHSPSTSPTLRPTTPCKRQAHPCGKYNLACRWKWYTTCGKNKK